MMTTAKPTNFLLYRSGFKYVTHERFTISLPTFADPVRPVLEIPGPASLGGKPIVILHPDGLLVIEAGYAWNGASGPAWDHNFIVASLVHDVLYQLIRLLLLSPEAKDAADDVMYWLCVGAGMWKPRAYWCWLGVHVGGWSSTLPQAESAVKAAPAVFGK